MSYNFAQFGSHRQSGSRDIIIFSCHVTWQAHVIRALYDFIVRSTPKISHPPNMFHGHRHCASGDILVLACHMILQDHMIKGSFDFVGRSLSR